MSRPRICELLHSMSVGGAEVLALRLARGLASHYDVQFVCLDEIGELGQELQAEGYRITVLGRMPGVDWSCARRLGHWLRQEQVDLVHAHQYTPFFYALAARLRRPGLPILFTEHGRFHPDRPNRKRMVFNRLMLRRRDRVIAVGQAVRNALIDNEGIPARRIGVIYNGIDLRPFQSPSPTARKATRAELGLPDESLVIIQVARLDALKDHVTAIRALRLLQDRHPQVYLLLVGDGPERGTIEAEMYQLGVNASVRMLGLRRDVPRLLQCADVCLLTSLSEGIPLTLIEGMAAGLPVVATDVGGVHEVVERAVTGMLVPAGDHRAVAEAVRRLTADPTLRTRMGMRGARRAAEVFAEQKMHEAYRRLIDTMLARDGQCSAGRAEGLRSASAQDVDEQPAAAGRR